MIFFSRMYISALFQYVEQSQLIVQVMENNHEGWRLFALFHTRQNLI